MARFRHELKFIINLNEADDLFRDALVYCDYDPHVTETNSYEIASIYYDTADLRFYYDREESVGYRRKIRLRTYNHDRKATALFIEIKEKHKQFVLKKRINLRSMDILDQYERHDRIPLQDVLMNLEDCAEARELQYLEHRLHLFPVVNIRYHRRPLIPKFESDMRITLDTRITAGGSNLGKYNEGEEKIILAPDTGVLEIKTNQSIPIWLQSLMMRYHMTQTRYSKYCLGVDAVFGRGGKQWLVSGDDLSRGTALEHPEEHRSTEDMQMPQTSSEASASRDSQIARESQGDRQNEWPRNESEDYSSKESKKAPESELQRRAVGFC